MIVVVVVVVCSVLVWCGVWYGAAGMAEAKSPFGRGGNEMMHASGNNWCVSFFLFLSIPTDWTREKRRDASYPVDEINIKERNSRQERAATTEGTLLLLLLENTTDVGWLSLYSAEAERKRKRQEFAYASSSSLSSSNWRMEKRKRKKKDGEIRDFITVPWDGLSFLPFFFILKLLLSTLSSFCLFHCCCCVREREKVKTDKLIVPFFLWVWIFYFYFSFRVAVWRRRVVLGLEL